ncbi:MAG: Uma2 family endonuclease [Acidobacteria bacterium]|nr:Uma2 family endonuclease [Acidobacteriota bacterium]
MTTKVLMDVEEYLRTSFEARLALEVIPEIRIPIHPRRYRVADIAVWRVGDIGERIPTVPPFLAIEILSSEDRMVRMQPKIQEYLSIGVEWIWLIDPDEQKAICYSQKAPAGFLCETLKTENPTIEIALGSVFRFQTGC